MEPMILLESNNKSTFAKNSKTIHHDGHTIPSFPGVTQEIINTVNRRLATSIQIHISAPIATNFGTQVVKSVKGCQMKELFQRALYFKVQSKQKQIQHAGIQHTTLTCLSTCLSTSG